MIHGHLIRSLCLLTALFLAEPAAAQDPVVRQLQSALNAQGFNAGLEDGVWGQQTKTALFAFQTAKGFKTSEAINTWQAILLGLSERYAGSEGEILVRGAKREVVGSVDAAITAFVNQSADMVMHALEEQTGVPVMSTKGYPLVIEFQKPDLLEGSRLNLSAFGRDYVAFGVDMKGAFTGALGFESFLEIYLDPKVKDEVPDKICEPPNSDMTGIPPRYICVQSGSVGMGGIFSANGSDVSCHKGSMTFTNGNRSQRFAIGTECHVNGHPVRLTETGWILIDN